VTLKCCCLPGKLGKQIKLVTVFVYSIDEIPAIYYIAFSLLSTFYLAGKQHAKKQNLILTRSLTPDNFDTFPKTAVIQK